MSLTQVPAELLAPNAISSAALADGSVTTAKIADAAVATAKLADAAVSTAKIADLGVTPAKMSQKLTSGTVQATTSGTSKDFTGIPDWVKRITVVFNAISTNATGGSQYIVQLGDSGGIETTGYQSSVAVAVAGNGTGAASATTGFILISSAAGATTISGTLTLTLADASTNTWVGSVTAGGINAAGGYSGGGSKSLSAALDRIRLTTLNGTDAFDAGSVNILYE